MSTPEQLMIEIRQLLQQARYPDAAAACREALAEAPDHADLRMLMGLCEEAAGRPDHGRAWMEKALEKQAQHPDAGFHLGRLLLLEGRDEDARAVLDRCIAVDAHQAATRTLLARIEQRAGNSAAAIEALQAALVADADYAPAHAGLAALLLRKARLEEAHAHATEALRLRPEDALIQVAMAQVLQAQGQFDSAEQCLRNALEQQPDHPQLRAAMDQLQRIRAAAEQDSNGDAAARQESMLLRMRAHYRQGQLLAAAELADLLQFRLEASDPTILELAEVLMDAGQADAVSDLLERADASLPRHGLTCARLSASRGELETAQQQLAELFDSDLAEIRHDARRLSSDLYLRQQNLNEALETLRPLAAETDVPAPSVRMLAQLEHAGGETATARALLSGLLERDGLHESERAVSHNLLGRILDESGAYQAAGRHLAQGEWRSPLMVDELAEVSPADLQSAWFAQKNWTCADQPVDDGRPAPIFVSGWPGSGREALLPVLLSAAGLALLPPEELMRRREILRLPADPPALASVSDAELRLARKRYLRGAPPGGSGLLEPGQMEVTALPALARFFPGATLLWICAEEASLKLHWRLAGCREIDRMIDAWRGEQALFAHLSGLLPLKIVQLELDELLGGSVDTLSRLAKALAVESSEALAAALKSAFAQAGYRPSGHWRHYIDLI